MNSSGAALTLFLIAASLLPAQAHPGGPGSCCQSYRTKVMPLERLVSYEIRSNCPLPAIVFHTIKDREVCADPRKKWTQAHMSHLRPHGEERTP